jgi:AAHS family 4-hydroxybenzoate transporter-like MFS transporter
MKQAADKISKVQFLAIAICFLMNMCDGMNVMAISYVTNAISREWKVAPSNLGLVFSAGLLGMALGAMLLAPKADLIGRKSLILISALWMGIASFSTGFAQSITMLVFLRLLTGLGIGCMLACTSTLAAEYAPQKTKSFWISFVMAGYPAGAVLSGLTANYLVIQYGWRVFFFSTGIVTLLATPVAFLFLNESLEFLLKRQPANALNRINCILKSMNKKALALLPNREMKYEQSSVVVLFNHEKRKSTLVLWVSFFLSFAALYFLTSWIPKLALISGMSASLAIYAGILFNLGALLGIIFQGYLSAKFGLKNVICYFLLGTALLMMLFGFVKDPIILLLLFSLIGFGIQGGFIGLYAVAARLYETEIRSTGIGWAIGFGRLGAIIGPFLGGIFISQGIPVALNFTFFAIPVFIAGIATLFINLKKEIVYEK